MGPGGIATIIAASALAVIAVALAFVIIRVGRLIDEASVTLKSLTDEVSPLIDEVHTTVQLVNGPLASFNKITKSVEDVTTKVTKSTEDFIDKNQLVMKVAGAILGASKLKKEKKASTKQRKSRKVTDEEFE